MSLLIDTVLFYLFILFLSVLGLYCFTQAFSGCGKSGLLSLCSDFSCGTWAQGHAGFSSCSKRVQ